MLMKRLHVVVAAAAPPPAATATCCSRPGKLHLALSEGERRKTKQDFEHEQRGRQQHRLPSVSIVIILMAKSLAQATPMKTSLPSLQLAYN